MEPDQLWEAVRDYVLVAVKLGSRRGVFTRPGYIRRCSSWRRSSKSSAGYAMTSFRTTSCRGVEFTIRKLVRLGLLEEKVVKLDEIDGLRHTGYVYIYRLTRAGRALAKSVAKRLSPRIKKKMKELLRLSLWELIGYAYIRHPDSRSVFADDELLPTRLPYSTPHPNANVAKQTATS